MIDLPLTLDKNEKAVCQDCGKKAVTVWRTCYFCFECFQRMFQVKDQGNGMEVKKARKPRKVNPCGRTVNPENAYEVWASRGITYWVVKKYQSEEKENEPYARWLVYFKSVYEGDVMSGPCDSYVSSVKMGACKIENPFNKKEGTI